MKIPCKLEQLESVMNYVEEQLGKYKLDRRGVVQFTLMAEEAIVLLMKNVAEGAEIEVVFRKMLGDVSLSISAPGDPLESVAGQVALGGLNLDDAGGMDDGVEDAIRALLRSRSDVIQYKNRAHRNTIKITVKRSSKRQLKLTLGALVAAILLGLLFRGILTQAGQVGLDKYVLTPVKTMFLNALKMVIAPVVFFSIVSCLSQFDNLRELGKIGAKVMGFYMLTTILSTLVGLGAFFAVRPGDASLAASVTDAAQSVVATSQDTTISILDTVVGIVPSNFVKPFLECDMLQIIFMAVLCGIAVGIIGDYSKPLREFFEACNCLFLKITTLIVKVIPLAILCSIMSLVMTTGTQMIVAILRFLATFVMGLAVMVGVYGLLVLVIGRMNPINMLRKHMPTMLTSFSLGSSNAAIPFNIESCKRLGISPKVCSFSIPLGATVNMDGSCIYLVVAGLFLARVFGVEIRQASLLSMVFSVIVLSVGAPGIPGSGLVCLSVLLLQLGVPTEALSLVMGIDAIMGMFGTAVNTTGDVAVSLIVARTENLLDMETYRK